MNKTRYEKIEGVIFPITTLDNGMTIVDYPMYPVGGASGKTSGLMKQIMDMAKDKGFKVILNGNEYSYRKF